MAALECRKLSRWYGDVIAVNDIDCSVGAGVTGLLGPNGSGKSTLMRLAVGLLRPSAGSIEVLDEAPWGNPELLRRVGYLPEGDPPWPHLPARECAARAARLSGLEPAAARDAADEAIARVGLTDAADRPAETFSQGMRQRLKLALAIQHDPEFLILDEPLLGTDPLARRHLLQLMRRLGDEGRSILVSTHVLPDIEALTERVLLLRQGRLLAHGSVPEIRDLLDRHPRSIRIGTPEPRELGAALWQWDSVLSVQTEGQAVVVRTTQPKEFHARLQAHLIASDTPFSSVTAQDEGLEAVFEYLVG